MSSDLFICLLAPEVSFVMVHSRLGPFFSCRAIGLLVDLLQFFIYSRSESPVRYLCYCQYLSVKLPFYSLHSVFLWSKVVALNWPSLSTFWLAFTFMANALVFSLRTVILWSWSFSFVFSSRSFTLIVLILRSAIQLKLILVSANCQGASKIIFSCGYPSTWPSTIYWKGLLFSHCTEASL